MARKHSRIRDFAVYAAIRLLTFIVQMFPIDANLRTARLFGWLWYRTIRRHRERARQHLRLAYGQSLTEQEIDRIALKSCQQMAMMAMELLFTPRLITPWTFSRYIRLKDLSEAVKVLLSGNGAILVTGHYGNWELLGYTLACLGFDLTAVMRPLDNPYINEYVVRTRAKGGLKLVYKKGMTETAQQVLSNRGALCFIADQNAGRKGLFVDFFGRKASTYKSIGLLAIRYKVPIIIGYARRLSDRFEYEIGLTRVIRPEEWAGRDDELLWITQEYTKAIEQFVREDPTQYLWVHRRWKTRPPEEQHDGPSQPTDGYDGNRRHRQLRRPETEQPLPCQS